MDKLLRNHIINNQALDYNRILNRINSVFSSNYAFTKEDIDQRIQVIKQYQKQLAYLQMIPVIQQRTPEWFEARSKMISASDFAQALDEAKFGTQKDFFKKKCGFEDQVFDPYCAPLKWGCMFESVASDIYTLRNKYKVFEFGLLKHPTIKHFGASPDGINEFGVMLEIKCPYKRKITGEVPQQYYYQIQGQLDTCGLKECDYLESEFQKYYNKEEFMNDEEFGEKGVIIELQNLEYIYSDVVYQGQQLEDWLIENETIISSMKCVTVHYWKLGKFNVVRVYKDEDFLKEKFLELETVWDKIKEYKGNKPLYDKDIISKRKKSPPKGPKYQFIEVEEDQNI